VVAARIEDEVLERETDVVPTAAVKAVVVPTVLFENSAVVTDEVDDVVVVELLRVVEVVELLRVIVHEVATPLESV
jgi:hypothetical protein